MKRSKKKNIQQVRQNTKENQEKTGKISEKAKTDNIARLEALSQDQTVGIVKRNMAVQQLAQAKGEDSLPLQKAKLTQEAVVRRLKKATDAAAIETQKAQKAATEAEAASAAAADATKQVELALKEIQQQIKAAQDELDVLKRSSGSPQGLLFWKSREIEEKKKSLPKHL